MLHLKYYSSLVWGIVSKFQNLWFYLGVTISFLLTLLTSQNMIQQILVTYALIFNESFNVLCVKCMSLYRGRATAEECLKHPWLTQSSIQDPSFKVKGTLEANVLQGDFVPEIHADIEKPETEESLVTEELIVVTSYTLGQCRQSEKEKMEQKAVSKRFKFEEPLLQEIPGEFIY
jgi:hypothetical protein